MFRKNLTENHLLCLNTTARMVNSTANTLFIAHGMGSPTYWRRYVNDLVRLKYIATKTIYSSEEKGGLKLGAMYCLTQDGATVLEETFEDGEIFYPRGGIEAKSPFQFPHRLKVMEVMAHALKMEKSGGIEVLDMFPHFRHVGSNRLGTGKAYCSVNVPTMAVKDRILVPDLVIKIRVGGAVRLIMIEVHRHTDTARVIKQLKKHSIAIETKIFQEKFEHPDPNYVFSIHVHEKKLKNVVDSIRDGGFENFERYKNGYFFSSFDDITAKGLENALYSIDGERCKILN